VFAPVAIIYLKSTALPPLGKRSLAARASDNLVGRSRFAAPVTPQIIEQDLDHVVLVTAAGLTRGVGVIRTYSIAQSGELGASGSSAVKSMPAPAMRPASTGLGR
jgi:hypothetical protein